jgi:hypothetical protein
MKAEIKSLAFQVGTDIIGQPFYHIHSFNETTNRFGKKQTVVTETKEIG